MGLSEQWVAVRGDALEPVSASGMQSLGVHHGWTWARGWDAPDVGELVSRLAREAEAAAIGGWVADSDCAYLVFATPAGEIGARVAINETLSFGEPVAGMTDLWADTTARSVAFENLATWSERYADRRLDAAQLMLEMPGMPDSRPPVGFFFADDDLWIDDDGESGWVFAEDGVRLVYDRLGIIGLDEIVFASGDLPPGPNTSSESAFRLFVHAPDVESMKSIFQRLYPRFGDRVHVSAPGPQFADLLAQQPEQKSADPPGWVLEGIADLESWLRETGVDSLTVILMEETKEPDSIRARLAAVWTIHRPD